MGIHSLSSLVGCKITHSMSFLCSVYVEMTDLLREFNEPAVMDIKMGIR